MTERRRATAVLVVKLLLIGFALAIAGVAIVTALH
jgi:hypothetical protein